MVCGSAPMRGFSPVHLPTRRKQAICNSGMRAMHGAILKPHNTL